MVTEVWEISTGHGDTTILGGGGEGHGSDQHSCGQSQRLVLLNVATTDLCLWLCLPFSGQIDKHW